MRDVRLELVERGLEPLARGAEKQTGFEAQVESSDPQPLQQTEVFRAGTAGARLPVTPDASSRG